MDRRAEPAPASGGAARTRRVVRVESLGLTDYEPVLERQRELQARLRDERGPAGRLLLTEHRPVITLGRNHPVPDLRVPAAAVAAAGIPIVHIERGGDITYHGPGQLVAYPIVDLRAWRLGPVDFVTGLEETVTRVVSAYGIAAGRHPDARGAWVGARKIASVGVNVRGGVTMHGVALNVAPDFSHFEMINACGLPGVEMTGIERETGLGPTMREVERRFAEAFGGVFGCDVAWSNGAP